MSADQGISAEAIGKLRGAVRGGLIGRDHEGYEEARRVYNAMIARHPAVIVQAEDAADVIASVRFAGEHQLPLAGRGPQRPGIRHLRRRRRYRSRGDAQRARGSEAGYRAGRRRRRAGGARPRGARLRLGHARRTHLDDRCGGGLTLGGGIGAYLTRRFGLTCDNLLSAQVVTADGHLVRAAPDENDDLFWALRGGGGNFGVVTEFEFQLHPVDRVVGGPMLFEASAAQQVASFYRDYIAQAPRELGAFLGFQLAPPLPFIPEHRHLDPMCLIVACWSGPPDEAEQALAPLRGAGPVVAELVGPMPYPALQAAFDALVPRGLQHYWKADFVAELTDEAIGIHAERGATVPCVNSAVHLYPIDGAVHDVPDAATAFAHRRARFALNIAGIWPDPNDNATNIAWVRDYYAAVHPHSGYEGGYTNFGAGDDDNRVKANYGASYEHLAEVKRRWDPGNLFRLNQNVEPSSA